MLRRCIDMTDEDMGRISSLKQQGKSAVAIAEMLHLPANTVKSYLRRHPGTEDAHICPQCEKAVTQNKGRKEKRFCSDRCRMGWWSAHQSEMDKKAYYTLVCQQCGKEFVSYGNQGRKFCSRECYGKHRRKAAGAVFGG